MPETPSTSAACARCGYDKANHKREAHAFTYPDGESFLAGLDDLADCTPEEAVEAVKAVRASAAYESVLYGWLLERKGEVVRVVCTFCRYSFTRRLDDTMREFAETAAQHDCRPSGSDVRPEATNG